MTLLHGRRGICFGVANHRSIAWHIAKALSQEGAALTLVAQNPSFERRVAPLAEEIGAEVRYCDVTEDADIEKVFDGLELDFLVHSLAFASKESLHAPLYALSRSDFLTAFNVSVYSFLALTRAALDHFAPNASVLTLSYLGADRVLPGYDVMAPAKAALECSVKYLAHELGPKNIRVNAISAGPMRTLASSAVPNIHEALAAYDSAPLSGGLSGDALGSAAAFLISDLSRAMTGQILPVDMGLHLR